MMKWAIGVDLGGTKLRVALVDAQGRVTGKEDCLVNNDPSPDWVIESIATKVKTLRESSSVSSSIPVGVAVAGQVEAETGMVRYAPNLNWRNVQLQKNLAAELQLPVTVLNDVRAATWGEWQHGAGAGCDDLICLFIGTGVGGGAVSGGQLLTGCTNTAGEFGHTVIDTDGRQCQCGNRGCLEATVGGWAIAQRAQEAIQADRIEGAALRKLAGGKVKDLTARMVAQAFADGDPLAEDIVDDTAVALVAGVASLVNALNPCRVILGGGVMEGLPVLIDRVKDGVPHHVLKAANTGLEIVPAKLGDSAGLTGAAAWSRHAPVNKERKAA